MIRSTTWQTLELSRVPTTNCYLLGHALDPGRAGDRGLEDRRAGRPTWRSRRSGQGGSGQGADPLPGHVPGRDDCLPGWTGLGF